MKDKYGRANAKAVKKLQKIANLVLDKEQTYLQMTNEQLAQQTQVLRNRLANGATLDDILPDAFAVCREASARVLHQRHYPVQIMGGIALHQGRICQMSTGEGKTLTETLPAYLNALTGKGVHIITVNEYLAQRDCDWMGKVFRFLGLTVGITLSKMSLVEKQQAYLCDITYGTNNEFGFDYLRDNMSTTRKHCVQRELNFVIVDEVDSVLIDEARTPLIISGPSGESDAMYVSANNFVVRRLKKSTNTNEEGKTANKDIEPNGDFVVDRKEKNVRLTDSGIAKAEEYFKIENLSDPENIQLNHYINNALRANALMFKDVDYIKEHGEIVIVDAFTGRKMEGRRFSNGLHQALEAKEDITVKKEDKTFATITFQNFFRLYRKLSGMTGTAKTEEEEFNKIYNIDVVAIPTNKPLVRVDRDNIIYTTREAKLNAIVREIIQRNQKGQPVLVGTVSVEKSVELSNLLKKAGIKHNVLNAKEHENEALVIAQAGRVGSVTIATNMAGRGTDILLGGNAEVLAKQELKKNKAVDNDLIEQAVGFVTGDPQVDYVRELYNDQLQKFVKDTVEQRQKVVEAGGLCVIGTEMHDSRRIDDQLRGRSGRQGDPGCSMFFISTEDDMVRIFGGERIAQIMAIFRFGDDRPIEDKSINRLVTSAQKRIEGMHFASRKTVLQYDDVNNQQRKSIYRERNRILDNQNVHDVILEMIPEYARLALADACNSQMDVTQWDIDQVNKRLGYYFAIEQPIWEAEKVTSARQVCDMLTDACSKFIQQRSVNEAEETDEHVPFAEAERFVLLSTIDRLWMDHLDALDDLRQGIGLQAIGQHDPISVYKKESFEMFDKLNDQIKIETMRMLIFSTISRNVPVMQKRQITVINAEKDPNGLCPCGSGNKYKNCCLGKDLLEQKNQGTLPQNLSKEEEYALKRALRDQDKGLKRLQNPKR